MNDRLKKIFQQSISDNNIPNELYQQHNVKKGLRNENKTGVLVGLTRICDVVGYEMVNGQKADCDGQLFYRGISIFDLINHKSLKLGSFEEICYLLMFGKLPTKKQYELFTQELRNMYELPEGFTEVNILRYPSYNIMNKIQRALLMLYSDDPKAEDTSVENTLAQGLNILAKLPAIIVYSYYGKIRNFAHGSLIIHPINNQLTIAESILSLLRPDQKYTPQEAELLDIIMCLHAEHGGGNNSTFANVVISSTSTDLYSCLAGAVGSLKGPRHGGANEKVVAMMQEAKQLLGLNCSDQALNTYINQLADKQAFDQSGLVYGFGHAIYTKSDPRSVLLSQYCQQLATEKQMREVYAFYQRFEQQACAIMSQRKQMPFCANLDFYSGLAYEMLNIPTDLFSPIFVASRTIGWLAHNIENKLYCDRIVRPATKYIGQLGNYIPMEERDD